MPTADASDISSKVIPKAAKRIAISIKLIVYTIFFKAFFIVPSRSGGYKETYLSVYRSHSSKVLFFQGLAIF
jgi:hypothetical protein